MASLALTVGVRPSLMPGSWVCYPDRYSGRLLFRSPAVGLYRLPGYLSPQHVGSGWRLESRPRQSRARQLGATTTPTSWGLGARCIVPAPNPTDCARYLILPPESKSPPNH